MDRAKFRSKNNKVVFAELVDLEEGTWEIVTYDKKMISVRRTNRDPGKNIGKCLKEVREVKETLDNKSFKRKYFPANYAGVDMYDLTDYPDPEPVQTFDSTPVSKTGKTKQTKSLV